MPDAPEPPRFIRIQAVSARLGVSRKTVYRWAQEGRFPRQIRVSHRVAVWVESEVDAWMHKVLEERDTPPPPRRYRTRSSPWLD